GAWFLGRFLYWNKTLKRSLIALDKTKRQFNKILGFLAWLIIFAGWGSLGTWIYLNFEQFTEHPTDLLFFWTEPNILITFFLASLWFNLYIFYKSSLNRKDLKRIN